MKDPWRQHLLRGDEEAGRETVEQLIHIFGRENVYVELQRHQERAEEVAESGCYPHRAIS